MVMWREFERKRSETNQGNIPEFALRECGRPQQNQASRINRRPPEYKSRPSSSVVGSCEDANERQNYGEKTGKFLINWSNKSFSYEFSITFMCSYTSRKVAGLIPDEVIGFFNLPNPFSRTMALGSTQLLTDMSTRNLPGVWRAGGA
jgi:hypothetical protein